MDDLSDFLRKIAAEPDDDSLRLILADWLEERGEQERAEFIRLQVELAGMNGLESDFARKTARMHRCGVLTRRGEIPVLRLPAHT